MHRALRTGDPEVVYGAGKTTAQVLEVVEALRASGDRAVLVTRATADTVEALRRAHDDVTVEGSAIDWNTSVSIEPAEITAVVDVTSTPSVGSPSSLGSS